MKSDMNVLNIVRLNETYHPLKYITAEGWAYCNLLKAISLWFYPAGFHSLTGCCKLSSLLLWRQLNVIN